MSGISSEPSVFDLNTKCSCCNLKNGTFRCSRCGIRTFCSKVTNFCFAKVLR